MMINISAQCALMHTRTSLKCTELAIERYNTGTQIFDDRLHYSQQTLHQKYMSLLALNDNIGNAIAIDKDCTVSLTSEEAKLFFGPA